MILLIIYFFSKKIETFIITRPSKCFDCEKHIINRHNIWSVWKALPTKCFDCENNTNGLHPYNTGPTKCFDCNFFLNKKLTI